MAQKIELPSNNKTLRGSLYLPEGEFSQAVLFLHGWTGKENHNSAAFLASKGIAAMTISFEGHNESDGSIEKISRADALENAKDAYKYFKALLPESISIVVAGNSFGGYIAALLTAEVELDGLSMRVPANYPDAGFAEPQLGRGHDDPQIFAWRKQLQPPDATRALRAMGNYTGKIQIIEAGHDDFVPTETIASYRHVCELNNKQLDYHYMKDWPHSLGGDVQRIEQYNTLLLEWLQNA